MDRIGIFVACTGLSLSLNCAAPLNPPGDDGGVTNPDASVRDGGAVDAGRADGGVADAGPIDGGVVDAGQADGGAAIASCTDLSGSHLLASWTCDGGVTDLAAVGVEITWFGSTPTLGTWTTKFFTPPGQTAVWCSRTHGESVGIVGSTVIFTKAAPAEACSTNSVPSANWSCTTGVGAQTCTHTASAPGTPSVQVYTCAVADAGTLTLSRTAPGFDGACPAGVAEVQTWRKQ